MTKLLLNYKQDCEDPNSLERQNMEKTIKGGEAKPNWFDSAL